MNNSLKLQILLNAKKAADDMRKFTTGASDDFKKLTGEIIVSGKRAGESMHKFTSSAAYDFSVLSRAGTKAAVDLNRFSRSTAEGFSNLSLQAKNLYKDFNGFSTSARLFVAAGGLEGLRRTLHTNLNFERDLLEMKQNAQLTVEQAAQMKKLALDTSKDSMQLPMDILQGEKAYARAGMKFEQIRDSIAEAARSATVMRSTVESIANMDFDLQTKFGISPKDMTSAHNMAYYHGNEGRFESPSMAHLAPVYLNALKQVGVHGMAGWNFTGALTQSIMKTAPATEPSRVATYIEQGLGHIAQYAKSLSKVGVDVKKYGPHGQFGVEGILRLAEDMKKHGLTDVFKLQKAGIRDEEAKKFWLQMMNDSEEIRKQMVKGQEAASKDQISLDLTEIKNADFGKVMAAEIEVEKLTLSKSAQDATGVVGNAAQYAADNPGKVAEGAGALGAAYLLNRYGKNRRARLAAEASASGSGSSKDNVQYVFVTNWPKHQMSAFEKNAQTQLQQSLKASGEMPVKSAGSSYNPWGIAALSVASIPLIGDSLGDSLDLIAKNITKDREMDFGPQFIDWLKNKQDPDAFKLNVRVEAAPGTRVLETKSNSSNLNVDTGLYMPGTH